MAQRHDDVPEGPVDPLDALTDDELVEAAAVAGGDPAAAGTLPPS